MSTNIHETTTYSMETCAQWTHSACCFCDLRFPNTQQVTVNPIARPRSTTTRRPINPPKAATRQLPTISLANVDWSTSLVVAGWFVPLVMVSLLLVVGWFVPPVVIGWLLVGWFGPLVVAGWLLVVGWFVPLVVAGWLLVVGWFVTQVVVCSRHVWRVWLIVLLITEPIISWYVLHTTPRSMESTDWSAMSTQCRALFIISQLLVGAVPWPKVVTASEPIT